MYNNENEKKPVDPPVDPPVDEYVTLQKNLLNYALLETDRAISAHDPEAIDKLKELIDQINALPMPQK